MVAWWVRLRVSLLNHVVLSPWFDYCILAVICANSVFLALDNPLDDGDTALQQIIAVTDIVRGLFRGYKTKRATH